MHRYWITWDDSANISPPAGVGLGCGVTAWNWDDAVQLLHERFGHELPPVASVIEDFDVSTLDAGHVLPNMGVVVWRGVWFPQG